MIHLHTIYMQVIYGVSVRLPSRSLIIYIYHMDRLPSRSPEIYIWHIIHCISIQHIYVSLTKQRVSDIYITHQTLIKQRISDIYIVACHAYQAIHCAYIYMYYARLTKRFIIHIYICTTSHLPSNAYTRIFIHPIFLPENF